ncbi:DUF3800 domain-containing protein [Leifsonia xyli]|uniref:DUF3800 domain-containing protein n=1 Tax=Leifsonia xyli TaxID=1575 RepID=UPI0009DC4762
MSVLHAYIDESGDRGHTPKASDHFILSAVVVRDSNSDKINGLLEGLRADLRKPSGNYLTWKNIRSHTDRMRIAQVIAGQQWLRVISVVACKRHLPPATLNQSQVYLYQLRFLLERLSWLARDAGEILDYTMAQIQCEAIRLTQVRKHTASSSWLRDLLARSRSRRRNDRTASATGRTAARGLSYLSNCSCVSFRSLGQLGAALSIDTCAAAISATAESTDFLWPQDASVE